jgi:serine/threonine-protein kinase HipA
MYSSSVPSSQLPNEFPQLAANEYFCLKAAERCGLDVPRYRLAEDGMALVVDRFDLRPDGSIEALKTSVS